MNTLFKTVWNTVRHCYVVVNEKVNNHAQATGKGLVAAALVMIGGAALATEALPTPTSPYDKQFGEYILAPGQAQTMQYLAGGNFMYCATVTVKDGYLTLGEGATVYIGRGWTPVQFDEDIPIIDNSHGQGLTVTDAGSDFGVINAGSLFIDSGFNNQGTLINDSFAPEAKSLLVLRTLNGAPQHFYNSGRLEQYTIQINSGGTLENTGSMKATNLTLDTNAALINRLNTTVDGTLSLGTGSTLFLNGGLLSAHKLNTSEGANVHFNGGRLTFDEGKLTNATLTYETGHHYSPEVSQNNIILSNVGGQPITIDAIASNQDWQTTATVLQTNAVLSSASVDVGSGTVLHSNALNLHNKQPSITVNNGGVLYTDIDEIFELGKSSLSYIDLDDPADSGIKTLQSSAFMNSIGDVKPSIVNGVDFKKGAVLVLNGNYRAEDSAAIMGALTKAKLDNVINLKLLGQIKNTPKDTLVFDSDAMGRLFNDLDEQNIKQFVGLPTLDLTHTGGDTLTINRSIGVRSVKGAQKTEVGASARFALIGIDDLADPTTVAPAPSDEHLADNIVVNGQLILGSGAMPRPTHGSVTALNVADHARASVINGNFTINRLNLNGAMQIGPSGKLTTQEAVIRGELENHGHLIGQSETATLSIEDGGQITNSGVLKNFKQITIKNGGSLTSEGDEPLTVNRFVVEGTLKAKNLVINQPNSFIIDNGKANIDTLTLGTNAVLKIINNQDSPTNIDTFNGQWGFIALDNGKVNIQTLGQKDGLTVTLKGANSAVSITNGNLQGNVINLIEVGEKTDSEILDGGFSGNIVNINEGSTLTLSSIGSNLVNVNDGGTLKTALTEIFVTETADMTLSGINMTDKSQVEAVIGQQLGIKDLSDQVYDNRINVADANVVVSGAGLSTIMQQKAHALFTDWFMYDHLSLTDTKPLDEGAVELTLDKLSLAVTDGGILFADQHLINTDKEKVALTLGDSGDGVVVNGDFGFAAIDKVGSVSVNKGRHLILVGDAENTALVNADAPVTVAGHLTLGLDKGFANDAKPTQGTIGNVTVTPDGALTVTRGEFTAANLTANGALTISDGASLTARELTLAGSLTNEKGTRLGAQTLSVATPVVNNGTIATENLVITQGGTLTQAEGAAFDGINTLTLNGRLTMHDYDVLGNNLALTVGKNGTFDVTDKDSNLTVKSLTVASDGWQLSTGMLKTQSLSAQGNSLLTVSAPATLFVNGSAPQQGLIINNAGRVIVGNGADELANILLASKSTGTRSPKATMLVNRPIVLTDGGKINLATIGTATGPMIIGNDSITVVDGNALNGKPLLTTQTSQPLTVAANATLLLTNITQDADYVLLKGFDLSANLKNGQWAGGWNGENDSALIVSDDAGLRWKAQTSLHDDGSYHLAAKLLDSARDYPLVLANSELDAALTTRKPQGSAALVQGIIRDPILSAMDDFGRDRKTELLNGVQQLNALLGTSALLINNSCDAQRLLVDHNNLDKDHNLWVEVHGGVYHNRNMTLAFGKTDTDITASGLQIGGETSIAEHWRAGGSIAYRHDTVDSNTLAADAKVNSFGLFGYVNYTLPYGVKLDGTIGYWRQDADLAMTIDVEKVKKASANVKQDAFVAGLGVSKSFAIDHWSISPYARLTAVSTRDADFDTVVDDKVAYRNTVKGHVVWRVPVGIAVKSTFTSGAWQLEPTADLSIVPHFGRQTKTHLTSAYTNGPVIIEADTASKTGVRGNLAVNAVKGALSARLAVDYNGVDKAQTGYGISARLNYAF